MRIITAGYEVINGQVVQDESNKLIHYMLEHELTELASKDNGWTILYKDKDNRTYWELTSPQSELQGGGPPQLRELSNDEVLTEWNLTT